MACHWLRIDRDFRTSRPSALIRDGFWVGLSKEEEEEVEEKKDERHHAAPAKNLLSVHGDGTANPDKAKPGRRPEAQRVASIPPTTYSLQANSDRQDAGSKYCIRSTHTVPTTSVRPGFAGFGPCGQRQPTTEKTTQTRTQSGQGKG